MFKPSLLLSVAFVFFVQVKIPAGMSRIYENVKAVECQPGGFTIRLTLSDDKIVYVPAFFTIIEEK